MKDMLNYEVKEESESYWSSPMVLITEEDLLNRFCVDYRRLNGVTRKQSYPLPRIDEILDVWASSKRVATLELNSNYWQVHPKGKKKRFVWNWPLTI